MRCYSGRDADDEGDDDDDDTDDNADSEYSAIRVASDTINDDQRVKFW
mgnify:FL=1